MFACWYNQYDEPRIVVGPDVIFSLVEMALVNGLIGMVLHSCQTQEIWSVFYAGLVLVVCHDLAFLSTVMYNQGLPPRNPNWHSERYLNKVKTIE